MDLYVKQKITKDGTRRVLQLKNSAKQPDVSVYYDLVGERDVPPPLILDGFLFAVIFHAMLFNEPLRVRGALTKECMMNLRAFQEAWVCWFPEKYQIVEIIPDKIELSVANRPHKAISAFSGGVDSTFTLLRHKQKMLGIASYPLEEHVMTVHGLDVALNYPIEDLIRRTQPLLDELGVSRKVVRTNLMELHRETWVDSFMAAIASCLFNYAHENLYALMGSAEPYNSLVLPLGCNPATDPLLSGGLMRLVHDGAGYSRTEKVAEVAKNPTAMSSLKVCYENGDIFRNCGICEKCVRTRLNFMAVGIANPPCFDDPFDINLVRSLVLFTDLQLSEFALIAAHARRRGETGEWLNILEEKVNSYKPIAGWRTSIPMRRFRKLMLMLRRGDLGLIVEKINRRLTLGPAEVTRRTN